MAPERIQAKPGSDAPAADIYSYGMLLFETLCHEEPFHEHSVEQVEAWVRPAFQRSIIAEKFSFPYVTWPQLVPNVLVPACPILTFMWVDINDH